jgi:hypothetical protein
VVSIDLNGIPHDVGTDIAAALENDPVLAHIADTEQQESEIEEQTVDAVNKEEQKDGKLILAVLRISTLSAWCGNRRNISVHWDRFVRNV